MRLSIYTFVRDGLFYDFHVEAMLRHHLDLADEIIVNEGYSTDGTYEVVSRIDPKVQVFRTRWTDSKGLDWYTRFKNEARRHCTGDWCLLLDADEFIPEWEFGPLRTFLESTSHDLVALRYLNFYGNFKVYQTRPRQFGWPERQVRIHRNLSGIEAWGDGANVGGAEYDLDKDVSQVEFTCHHFGFVREAARLRQKWHKQGRLHQNRASWLSRCSVLFDWLPHRWTDPVFTSGLATYDGPYVDAVVKDPEEFVRDGYESHRLLKQST